MVALFYSPCTERAHCNINGGLCPILFPAIAGACPFLENKKMHQ